MSRDVVVRKEDEAHRTEQLVAQGFAGIVASALERCGLDAHYINVEITESVLLMEGSGVAKSALAELRALGVSLHLDDFGTGYSSLAYLRDFHIDALKIDRSFVSGSGPSQRRGRRNERTGRAARCPWMR